MLNTTHYRRFAHRDFLDVFGYDMCVTFPFFFYSNGIISTFSMACIAVNRFVGIYFSRKMAHWFSAARSWGMVAGVWLAAYALLALPASGAWGQVGHMTKLSNLKAALGENHFQFILFS